MRTRRLLLLVLVGLAAVLGACATGDGDTGTVREYHLTAEVVEHEVVDGEIVEVWGYNGQYPGPTIEAEVGDTIRVVLTNNLPEATSIHWHGLEVPNEQDGVPGITQPAVEPGQTWTYEFKVDKAGTTMYHTHANTVRQLARGLVGPLIVHEKPAKAPKYDAEHIWVLHEIDGLFTMNGLSFPKTLENEDTLIQVKTGDKFLLRIINAGQQHHPMHLHGHQFKVVALDSNPVPNPYFLNTVDIAPGQTVDVEVVANNPGTWTFHCHVLPHVTNRGAYPGGMLAIVDYIDHTSYLEDPSVVSQQPGGVATEDHGEDGHGEEGASGDDGAAAAIPAEAVRVEGSIDIAATEFAFRPAEIVAAPGEEITIRLRNDGAVLHNLEIVDLGLVVEAAPGTTEEITFTVPEDVDRLTFICNIPGHREAGMEGILYVSG